MKLSATSPSWPRLWVWSLYIWPCSRSPKFGAFTMPKIKMYTPARLAFFAAACLILVVQAAASRILKINEQKIGIPGFDNLPWQVGRGQATAEQSIGPDVTAYLKPDEY